MSAIDRDERIADLLKLLRNEYPRRECNLTQRVRLELAQHLERARAAADFRWIDAAAERPRTGETVLMVNFDGEVFTGSFIVTGDPIFDFYWSFRGIETKHGPRLWAYIPPFPPLRGDEAAQ